MKELKAYNINGHAIVLALDNVCGQPFFVVRTDGRETFAGKDRGKALDAFDAAYGEPLVPGEWLVHSGDGVGIASAIAASYKRLTLADWLAYSEHNATPGLHAKTDARQGSPEWQRCVDAVRSFAQEWAIVTGRDVDLGKIDLGASGTLPYPVLVEAMNKSIAALWRGSDLSTLSARAEGASLQGEEMDMLEQSAAEDISETLHEQIDRFVVEWAFGRGVEPLARFALVPVSRPDVDKEIAINEHLVRHGARLPLADECQRFGRRMAEEAEEALGAAADGGAETRDGRKEKRGAEEDGLPKGGETEAKLPNVGKAPPKDLPMLGKNAEELPKLGKEETAFARALQRDLRPVAKALQAALARGEGPGEIKRRLERILAECGTESAAALEEAMKAAGEAGFPAEVRSKKEEVRSADLANEITHPCPKCHCQLKADGTCTHCAKGGDGSPADAGLRALIEDDGDGLSEIQKAELEQGQASAAKALETQADVFGAMEDPELGTIDFRWESNGRGIKHIVERRNAYKASHPDAPSGEEVVRAIPSVIVRGERHTEGVGLRADTIIEYGGNRVILTPSHDGKPSNRWVLSSYDINPDAAGYRHKNGRGVSGEGVNSSGTTRRKPTGASSSAGSASSSPQYTTPAAEGKEESR